MQRFKTVTGRLTGQPASYVVVVNCMAWHRDKEQQFMLCIKHARTIAFRSEQMVLLIVAVGIGSPFFNVKREQEITKEEVAMPFLYIYSPEMLKFWMQDYRFNLQADIFPKSSSWAADFKRTVPSITKAYSEVLFKLLLSAQYTISMDNLCHETCRVMLIKMKSSCSLIKNGEIGQNTLYSFSSCPLNVHGPN